MSIREAARVFGVHRKTVRKVLRFSIPPGYQRSGAPRRPKLDGFTGVIDQILATDAGSPPKQRHTSKRIYERLRDEHGFAGGYTIVKDYVRSQRLTQVHSAPCKGTVSQWVRIPPGNFRLASSNRSRRGGNEAAEAFGVEGH
jgi:transposase